MIMPHLRFFLAVSKWANLQFAICNFLENQGRFPPESKSQRLGRIPKILKFRAAVPSPPDNGPRKMVHFFKDKACCGIRWTRPRFGAGPECDDRTNAAVEHFPDRSQSARAALLPRVISGRQAIDDRRLVVHGPSTGPIGGEIRRGPDAGGVAMRPGRTNRRRR